MKLGRERERDSTLLYLQCVKTELWGVYKAQERTKVKTSRIDRRMRTATFKVGAAAAAQSFTFYLMPLYSISFCSIV